MAVSCTSQTVWTTAPTDAPSPAPPVRGREHRFQQQVQDWKAIRIQNVVMQRFDYSCGASALATLLRYFIGDPVTERHVLVKLLGMLNAVEMKDRVKKGFSMTDLRRVAVKMGYLSTIGRLEFDKLRESKVPLIVGLIVNEYDHFVVYRGMDDRYVYLADPSRGNIRTPIPEFVKQWQKNAILVVIKKGQKPSTTSPLQVRPEEFALGKQNRLYLRDRIATKVIPPR